MRRSRVLLFEQCIYSLIEYSSIRSIPMLDRYYIKMYIENVWVLFWS